MKRLLLLTGLATGILLTALTSLLVAAILTACFPVLSFALTAVISYIALSAFGAAPLDRYALYEATTSIGARMQFKNAVELVMSIKNERGEQMYDVSHAVCTASFLRGQAVLSASTATYNIPLLKSQQETIRANQQLLALQDIFVTFSMGMWITVGDAANSAAVPYSYGNVVAFSTSGAAAALWTVYNGKVQLLNNNQQVVPAFDMLRFYKAPITQAVPDLYYDGAATALNQDSKDTFSDVFTPIEPGWVINGAGNMVMSVVCATAPAVIQAGVQTSIDCIQRGILLQNVTPVN